MIQGAALVLSLLLLRNLLSAPRVIYDATPN